MTARYGGLRCKALAWERAGEALHQVASWHRTASSREAAAAAQAAAAAHSAAEGGRSQYAEATCQLDARVAVIDSDAEDLAAKLESAAAPVAAERARLDEAHTSAVDRAERLR